MISVVCWVPKGASKPVPEIAEPPSKEDIEEMLKYGTLERSGDNEEEEEGDGGMDVDSSQQTDEVAHALAVSEALGKTQVNKSSNNYQDMMVGFQDLRMEHYDEEEDGIELFSTGLGETYYPSNDMDPYLKNNDDDDDDEDIEDLTIKPTDAVIVCARNEDEVSHLEVWIYEESEDGSPNMYVHHDIILPAFPLCSAWLDCNLKSGDKGNFIAVGSMESAIEIWDLDLLDEVQPFLVLGGESKKKKKGKKTSAKTAKYRKGSHRDSVLSLAWNKEVRNVLASASADKSVKIWDLVTGKCALTVEHHSDKVQSVAWNRNSPELLLSGSFDRSVIMMDMKSNARAASKWSVIADVESLAWDPHNEYSFVVSLYDGTVQGFDTRAASLGSDSGSKPSFTLHAHDKEVCTVSYNPSVANLLATGSTDKMVKLWDISNNQPSCVASRNPKAGAVFSVSFSEDSPFLLGIGGSKGKLEVWDTLTDPGVQRFGNARNQRVPPVPVA